MNEDVYSTFAQLATDFEEKLDIFKNENYMVLQWHLFFLL